jgi:hypothetical protein
MNHEWARLNNIQFFLMIYDMSCKAGKGSEKEMELNSVVVRIPLIKSLSLSSEPGGFPAQPVSSSLWY